MNQKPVRMKKKGRAFVIAGLVLIGVQLLAVLGIAGRSSLPSSPGSKLGFFIFGIIGIVFLIIGYIRSKSNE